MLGEGVRPIVVVSGLPRSGTSMMMQMLEAGGVPILSDGQRRADEDNPKGYYELEAVKQTRQDASWLRQAPGRAVKMVSQLLLDLPPEHDYRVVFMRRDLAEILASQRVMLERRGEAATSGVADDEMARVFEAHLQETLSWVRAQPAMRLLEVWHASVVAEPAAAAAELAGFLGDLGAPLDVEAMAAAVDRGLHRQRGATVSQEDFMEAGEEEAVAKRLRDLGYL